jgi:hypothetical protein
VRREILDHCPTAGAREGRLDLAATVPFGLIWEPVGAAEHGPVAVPKTRQRSKDARMKWNAAIFAVLCVEEHHVGAGKIDLGPIHIERLRKASAGVEEEDHERPEVLRAGIDQAVGLSRR